VEELDLLIAAVAVQIRVNNTLISDCGTTYGDAAHEGIAFTISYRDMKVAREKNTQLAKMLGLS